MIFDLEKTLQSKRELRRELAARPLAEKLAMLDVLRERSLALRAANSPARALQQRKGTPSFPRRRESRS